MQAEGIYDLSGVVDMHIHSAPDVRPRLLNDLEVAAQARDAGMRGVLLKSHVTCTADRAAIAAQAAGGITVVGAVVLNYAVGGINPTAAEVALKLGARVIWMPTISAREVDGRPGTLSVWQAGAEGELAASVWQVLELAAQAGVAVATGHLGVAEAAAVVKAARAAGVRQIVVTHPDSFLVGMPVAVQQELATLGASFERCYGQIYGAQPELSAAELAGRIREVGLEHTVLSTDFGQVGRPTPVEGMRQFLRIMLAEGFSPAELRRMAGDNPAALLGL